MSYEYNNPGSSNGQSSLSGEAILAEKTAQAQKEKLKKKYRITSFALIGVIVVAVAALLMTQLNSGPPEQLEWSEWMETLPEYATEEFYNIEKQTLYRTRNLETTSSTTETSKSGWELYDTVAGTGDFGPWSDWSTSQVSAGENREVETQTRYRYRDKETTTGAVSTMSGWELYDTTYTWGNYGSWSGWSTSAVSNSSSRKVESKTQYRYRAITVSNQYSAWSSWSSWQDSAVSATDTRQVESAACYRYYYFLCHGCGDHNPFSSACGCGSTSNSWNETWKPISYASSSSSSISYTSIKRQTTSLGDGQLWYFSSGNLNDTAIGTKDSDGAAAIIEKRYRYRTRTVSEVKNYGNWSSWSDTAVSSSPSRQVETRKVYRYCDRSQVATYHFCKWGDWSSWSTTTASATSNKQVETRKFYRYRDQVKTTTYYFQRWSDWSGYTTDSAAASDTVEVETITQYRFKSKEK